MKCSIILATVSKELSILTMKFTLTSSHFSVLSEDSINPNKVLLFSKAFRSMNFSKEVLLRAYF